MDTAFPERGSKPAWTGKEGHGAVPSQISPLENRVRPKSIASPEVTYANIYDGFGAQEDATYNDFGVRKNVVRNTSAGLYSRIATKGDTE